MSLGMLDDAGDDVLRAQVCIIGAGAAGITLACELDAAGVGVLLVKAGGLKRDCALTDYYGGTARPAMSSASVSARLAKGLMKLRDGFWAATDPDTALRAGALQLQPRWLSGRRRPHCYLEFRGTLAVRDGRDGDANPINALERHRFRGRSSGRRAPTLP
jgi:glycine/D-amino acid oxidase-like deaminating enzyme